LDQPTIQRLLKHTPHVSQQELLASPHFSQARTVFLDRYLAIYGQDPFLVRLLIETGRFAVFLATLILDAAHDPARRETWFTVGRLKRQIASLGLGISERQVDYLIARLSAVGFLEMLRSDEDRRVRILKPSATMLAHHRDWLAAHYAPLTVLCPHNDYGPILRGDPAFQLMYRRTSLAFFPLGRKVLMSEPDMMLFFDRVAGRAVLAALLQAASADPDHLHAAVPYAEVGDRFGVSRTHVRQLLMAAERQGLVKLQGRGGHRVEIQPRLWASYDRAIAGGMFLRDLVYGVAVGRKAAQS
jgi:DNA-binding transcriptional ArsR family regulator